MTTSTMDNLGHDLVQKKGYVENRVGHALEQTKGFVEGHAWQAAAAMAAYPIGMEVAKWVEPDKNSASHRAQTATKNTARGVENPTSTSAEKIAEAAVLAVAALPPTSAPDRHTAKAATRSETDHSANKDGSGAVPKTAGAENRTPAVTPPETYHSVNKDGSGAVPKTAAYDGHPAPTKPSLSAETERAILAAVVSPLPPLTIESGSHH